MQEPHGKGLASHPGPESCGATREGGAEALTGGSAGELSSREITTSMVPTPLGEAEGNIHGRAIASVQGTGRGRRTSACTDTPCAGTGRSHGSPGEHDDPERDAKASSRTASMAGCGKSDSSIVPEKRTNNAAGPAPDAAEAVEGRGLAKGNPDEHNTPRTQSRDHGVPSALERVREAAKRDKGARFSALMHHVTTDRLRASYLRMKRRAAAGVDGVTWEEYGRDLDGNLERLHQRLRTGAYRAKPSRRVYIPKADGRQRPLGIAALEDKIVQGAVVEVLNAIYEEDFLGFSYGFRPGRNQHQALDALAVAIGRKKVNWVLDADIRSFFDVIDRTWMRRFIEHRIADRRLQRLVEKWLNAGVMEDGQKTSTETGTPQGATISPLLANIFLHYVFDLWANQWRRRNGGGDVIIVRYADDIVVGFQHRWEAERFRSELSARMGRFGLELHPDKTRLIEFGRFAAANRQERGDGKPETFDFLGFTHICGKARNGKFLLVRHTIKKRMRQALEKLKEELKRRMHDAVPEQGRWLRAVVRGYVAYHAVPTNLQALGEFRTEVVRTWLQSLRRRSQKHRLTWRRFNEIVDCWLPRPRTLHPLPDQRFDARTQGRSPVR